jgi:hypothetical protein
VNSKAKRRGMAMLHHEVGQKVGQSDGVHGRAFATSAGHPSNMHYNLPGPGGTINIIILNSRCALIMHITIL